ncbi:MAG: DUF11 domain-containing protein [Acidobacteria bacterium]|nr:DUF11 domain-containing protein [Acidobacteriota bacterium]
MRTDRFYGFVALAAAILIGGSCAFLSGQGGLKPEPQAAAAAPRPLAPPGAAAAPHAQANDRTLREARPGEVWITQPTVEATLPQLPSRAIQNPNVLNDTTAPTLPQNLAVRTSGLFGFSANWSPSSDAESGISYYAYAIGTGATGSTEANVKYWQSVGNNPRVNVNIVLTQGQVYYFSVKAVNGANLHSDLARSPPLTATPLTYGQADYRVSFAISPVGYDENGPTATWSVARSAEIMGFLDKMAPVLYDLYGPPSSPYTLTLVRDLRYTSSAVFFPSTDEIHLGDNASYQLITHELVHGWRRDRLLASDNLWQYNPTLSGFEEGFAQAVSYEAMTEFARRYPTFGLTQQIYQSSNEWDYDFQNTPELRTTDFWSDSGGMLLYWVRYEVAAAALAKIAREHPGFYRTFNAEFYRRLNTNPILTSSRALVKEIIQTVAPTIEGKAASDWIDQQYIFDCAVHPGKKVWLFTQHYPWTEYFAFNRTYFYETFSNGSDWSYWNGSGYTYYGLNGSQGQGTLRASGGNTVWQNSLLISPTDNPPVFYGFGKDDINLTTQATNLPWPGGDPSKFVTGLLSLDLYKLTVQFTSGSSSVTNNYYRVMGRELRSTTGLFGGIIGANGGQIYLNHRNYPSGSPVPIVNSAFWTTAPWATIPHPATNSVDTEPGIVDVTYVDATGKVYTDTRTIGYGSWNGNQAFLFDVSKMHATSGVDLAISKTHSGNFVIGANGVYTISVRNTGSAASSDVITVTDTLPAGMSFVSGAGAGWTCSAFGQAVVCATSASIAAGASAASLTLTVSLGTGAQGTVTNRASLSNSSDASPANNTAADSTTVLSGTPPAAPSALTAIACFGSEINLRWTDNSGDETAFILERKVGLSGSYTAVQTLAANATGYLDRGLTALATYYYRIRASNDIGASDYSNETNAAVASTSIFTDDPATAGITPVRAVHVTELRQAVDAVRACAGLTAATWTDPSLDGAFIRAVHFQELRDKLAPALATLGLPAQVYTDDPLAPGTTIKKVHLQELRQAIR